MKGKSSLAWLFLRRVDANAPFQGEFNPVCAWQCCTLGGCGKQTPAGSTPARRRCEADNKLLCPAQTGAETEHLIPINLGRFLFYVFEQLLARPRWQKQASFSSCCLHHRQQCGPKQQGTDQQQTFFMALSLRQFLAETPDTILHLLTSCCSFANWI